MKAKHPGAGLLSTEALLHDTGPQSARCPELGHLLKQVVVAGKEEGKPAGEGIHIKPHVNGCLNIGDAIGQSKGQLLSSGGPGLPYMVAANADGVPARHMLPAISEDIGDQPHRGAGREDIGPAGNILLQDVVLNGAIELRRINPLLFGQGDIHRQKDGGGGVYRH